MMHTLPLLTTLLFAQFVALNAADFYLLPQGKGRLDGSTWGDAFVIEQGRALVKS